MGWGKRNLRSPVLRHNVSRILNDSRICLRRLGEGDSKESGHWTWSCTSERSVIELHRRWGSTEGRCYSYASLRGKKDDRDTDASEMHFCGGLAMRSECPADRPTDCGFIYIQSRFQPQSKVRLSGVGSIGWIGKNLLKAWNRIFADLHPFYRSRVHGLLSEIWVSSFAHQRRRLQSFAWKLAVANPRKFVCPCQTSDQSYRSVIRHGYLCLIFLLLVSLHRLMVDFLSICSASWLFFCAVVGQFEEAWPWHVTFRPLWSDVWQGQTNFWDSWLQVFMQNSVRIPVNGKSTRAHTCTETLLDISKDLEERYWKRWHEEIGLDALVSPLTFPPHIPVLSGSFTGLWPFYMVLPHIGIDHECGLDGVT